MSRVPVILYAEDDPDDRELLKETLSFTGIEHRLIEAVNGMEALSYLQSDAGLRNRPVLVLLDLNMPILNGRETLQKIKEQPDTADIKVIVFTTSGSPADKEFCDRYQAEMITKPSTPDEMDRMVSYFVSII